MKPRTTSALLAVALTLVVLAVGAFIYLYSGAYNVAATREHSAPMRWVLNTLQTRSIAQRAEAVPAPPSIDSTSLTHGFEHFDAMCVQCHGAPGVERGELGRGITPTPPALAEEAEHLDRRELFWIVKHGIKLAGMPAFGPTHSDEEIWGIVTFVEELPGMSAEAYAARRSSGSGDHTP